MSSLSREIPFPRTGAWVPPAPTTFKNSGLQNSENVTELSVPMIQIRRQSGFALQITVSSLVSTLLPHAVENFALPGEGTDTKETTRDCHARILHEPWQLPFRWMRSCGESGPRGEIMIDG